MPFELPKVRPDAAERFPLQPRRVQQWLKALPDLDLDSTTQRLREALELANRQEAPAKARLESMELLSPTAVRALTALRKRLVARSLPLSLKTQAAFHMHQDLLWELQTGYTLALQEKAHTRTWPSRNTALAIHRGLELLYHEARMAWSLYQSLREGFWRRTYGLFRHAEGNDVLDFAPREALPTRELFLHTAILALSHPYGLRNGEIGRFAEYLKKSRPQCSILLGLPADHGDYVSTLDLGSDTPPEYRPAEDLKPSAGLRTIDLGPLLDALTSLGQTTGPGTRTTITNRAALHSALCRRLIRNLGSVPARRFSRIPRDDHVEVTFGIARIHHALTQLQPEPSGTGGAHMPALPHDTGEYPAHTATGVQERPWEMWDVINLGAGGYQLHWPQMRPSGAQVGEMLAIRIFDTRRERIHIGAVRWIQARAQGDLDIGVQLLAPRVVPIHLEHEEVYQVDNLSASPALWLPPVRALNQPPTVVAPVGRFQMGARVVVLSTRGTHVLELGARLESTGLFERFAYRAVPGRSETEPSRD